MTAFRLERILGSSCLSFRPPVHLSARNKPTPTERIFMKFDIRIFFKNLSRNLNFNQNLTRIKNTLHEDVCTFMIMSRLILLITGTVSDKKL